MKSDWAQEYLEKTQSDYESMAHMFSHTRGFLWREMADLISKYVKEGDSVLDLGCGNGRLWPALADKQVRYLGLDFSHSLIEKAQEKFPGAAFVVGDMTDLDSVPGLAGQKDSGPQKFNVIFLIASLHHIPSRQLQLKVLKQAYDHLVPGGFLIMENWNLHQRRFWSYWLTKHFHDPRLGFRDLLIPWKATPNKIIRRFCHAFSVRELARLLKASGLQVLDQYYVKKGVKSSLWQGHNIVSVAKK
ncbi:methyltransferase domain-containing protein [Candidatus Uhrbacteria bacterium]|nr:methyltransferase domain-containing protein [Candidatus Uhrbacteria bacterium]